MAEAAAVTPRGYYALMQYLEYSRWRAFAAHETRDARHGVAYPGQHTMLRIKAMRANRGHKD